MAKNVYWDACVFHSLFGNEDTADACLRIEKAANNGHVYIYTSAVTFVECVWLKTEKDPTGNLNKLSPKHEEIISGYFQRSYIRTINCDRNIAEAARKLLWQHQLKYKDAIHVASAIAQQVDVLHSFDNDLVKLDGKISGLKIIRPDKDGDFPTPQKTVELGFADAKPALPAPPPRPVRRFIEPPQE